ncbi:xylulokinase [Trueperella sp. LYQ143]|uniref:xylulokinase n=1 Tax=Trueperella sp. LYQ143 TaxID=3391059 RepID=UPI003982EAC3
MKPRYVAGVDSSTQSTKVLIVDPHSGEIVRSGKAPHPDGSEIDPHHWWLAFQQAVSQAGGLEDVYALSIGGQQHGMICLDEHGQVIRPALLWNDTRSAHAAQELIEELAVNQPDGNGISAWTQATGSAPVASLTITKLRWLADNEPENAEKIAAICLPHDWLTWKIAGSGDIRQLTTDRSDASGTGYLSRDAQNYRRDLLAQALRRSHADDIVLPKILTPWEVAGSGDPRQRWGHIQLGPGCGDNAGAALGIGLKPGQGLVSLGTSGVISAVSEHSIADPDGLVTGFADATGHWLPLVCTLNASRIVDAMARILGVDYAQFDELALSVPHANGLKLIPYFDGERTPNLPEARGELHGMTLANSQPAYIARAAIEALLHHMADALRCITRHSVSLHELILIGGGAQSQAVRHLAAQIFGLPVTIPPTREYVALGAARQAAQLR